MATRVNNGDNKENASAPAFGGKSLRQGLRVHTTAGVKPTLKPSDVNTRRGYGLPQATAAMKATSRLREPAQLKEALQDIRNAKVVRAPSLNAASKLGEKVYLDVDSKKAVDSKPRLDVENKEDKLKPLSPALPDPDATDKLDVFMCSSYIKSIMTYIRSKEEQYAIPSNYLAHRKILPSYRKQLLDWILQVHGKIRCVQEVFFLSVYLIDKYILLRPEVPKKQYQLVGITAFWIAAKFEEIYPPHHKSLVKMTDSAYTPEDMLKMEQSIIRTLKWDVNPPLACNFLRRASKVAEVGVYHHTMAKFFCEVALLDYKLVGVAQSKIAAAALCLSLKILKFENFEWGRFMEEYVKYSEVELAPTMGDIVVALNSIKNSRCQAVINKYLQEKQMSVAADPVLESPEFLEFANKTKKTQK